MHSGGGIVLLQTLLSALKTHASWMQLDIRAKERLDLPTGALNCLVSHSVFSRIRAEWKLSRTARVGDIVLSFHGLPPLFPMRAKVVVFIQNRLLIEQSSLNEYPLKIRLRIKLERLWCRKFQNRCSRYIVQTDSMAALLKGWLRSEIPISVIPFAPVSFKSTRAKSVIAGRQFDFVYVASGEAHKNHSNLLSAWRLLSEAGLTPSLALTVSPDVFPALSKEIAKHVDKLRLNIVNVGQVSSTEITNLYMSSTALIFPSKVESFGLPLIEASQLGLPILASELDFVRDVVEPVETFDPNSPVSIVRAVRRFLNNSEPITQIGTANEFLEEVLK